TNIASAIEIMHQFQPLMRSMWVVLSAGDKRGQVSRNEKRCYCTCRAILTRYHEPDLLTLNSAEPNHAHRRCYRSRRWTRHAPAAFDEESTQGNAAGWPQARRAICRRGIGAIGDSAVALRDRAGQNVH